MIILQKMLVRYINMTMRKRNGDQAHFCLLEIVKELDSKDSYQKSLTKHHYD
jgi:hypothetical protein